MKTKSGFAIVVTAAVLLGKAFTGLAMDKMRTVVDCKDARLYMDGAYRVFVQTGGISPHTAIQILKRNGLNWEDLGATNVRLESNTVHGIQMNTYSNSQLKMVVTGKLRPPLKGFPAQIQGTLASESISAPLACNNVN